MYNVFRRTNLDSGENHAFRSFTVETKRYGNGVSTTRNLEKISKHTINDIEIDNRGADFSEGGQVFFSCFWKITMVVLSWDESGKNMEIEGNLWKSVENEGNQWKLSEIERGIEGKSKENLRNSREI